MSRDPYVYIAHSGTMEIKVMRLDMETGALRPVQQVCATGPRPCEPAASLPLAISPDRRVLYAAIRVEPYSVISFAIDGCSGELTYLGRAPLPDSVAYISTDAGGRFLFAAAIPESREKPRNSSFCVSPIGAQGVALPPGQVVRALPKTHCIIPDPGRQYVMVAACDADCILRERFDAVRGRYVESLPPIRTKPGSGPRHMVFHPDNRRLYVLTEADGQVYVYDYDAGNAALTEVQVVTALPGHFVPKEGDHSAHAADIHITPDGRFLYASVRSSARTLAVYAVDPITGRLTHTTFVPTDKGPRSFAIDPYGQYLLVAGQGEGSITSFRIDSETGNLAKVARLESGKKPDWVEIVRLP